MGIHHVDLVVTSIERSLPFYRELLGPLGWHGISEVEGERGETIWYLGGPDVAGSGGSFMQDMPRNIAPGDTFCAEAQVVTVLDWSWVLAGTSMQPDGKAQLRILIS